MRRTSKSQRVRRPTCLFDGGVQPLIPARLALLGRFARKQGGDARPLVLAVLHHGSLEDLVLGVLPHAACGTGVCVSAGAGPVTPRRAFTPLTLDHDPHGARPPSLRAAARRRGTGRELGTHDARPRRTLHTMRHGQRQAGRTARACTQGLSPARARACAARGAAARGGGALVRHATRPYQRPCVSAASRYCRTGPLAPPGGATTAAAAAPRSPAPPAKMPGLFFCDFSAK